MDFHHIATDDDTVNIKGVSNWIERVYDDTTQINSNNNNNWTVEKKTNGKRTKTKRK